MVLNPSTMKEYEYSSPVRGAVVNDQTPSFPSVRSALPFKKSPVTWTLTALGAKSLNVTEWSGLISGDTSPVPGPSACWPQTDDVSSRVAAINNDLFMTVSI